MKQNLSWEEYNTLDIMDKIPYLCRKGGQGLFHVLFAQQFDRATLDRLCSLADTIRAIHKTHDGARFLRDTLLDKQALNLFAQPSTRTFMSFLCAEQNLGMSPVDIRDLSTSSHAKGESFQNSIRTFSSYVDLIVMRHPDQGACEVAAWEMNMAERRIPVLNGGSGRDQHPTQALLDIYTLIKSLGELDGKKIAMVGDLARGRTVRSLSYLMREYEGVELFYVAPPEFRIGADIRAFLKRHNIPHTECDDLSAIVADMDAVYMTRIQSEWDNKAGGSTGAKSRSSDRFVFKQEFLDRMKAKSCLLHPLPKINEIDPELDYIDDLRVVYWRQERNGMWARAALIAHVFEVEDAIRGYKAS